VSRLKEKLSGERFFGASPAPFVGRFGYPFVNVGILSPGETGDDVQLYDAPEEWAGRGLSVSKVVDYRAALVNSRAKALVKGGARVAELGRDVAMSSKPVDVEISFVKKPNLGLSFSSFSSPIGPSVEMKKAELASNPKIHAKVEKVYSDTGLKAADAINYLYRSSFDVNFLSKLLSVATLGLKTNRKLVPTRYSITATDDIIGKRLIEAVRGCETVDECSAYFGGYLGNYYLVLLFPEVWSYELFEAYAKGSDFSTDYEPYSGRKTYAENCSGGYYAARLPVLERLSKMKRQASVLVIRMITEEYLLPLGVWVCRESVRKAVAAKPISFSSKELMLKYAEAMIRMRFGYLHIAEILKSSRLLASLRQAKLWRYL